MQQSKLAANHRLTCLVRKIASDDFHLPGRTPANLLSDAENWGMSVGIMTFYQTNMPGDVIDALLWSAEVVLGAPPATEMTPIDKVLWIVRLTGMPAAEWRQSSYYHHFLGAPPNLGNPGRGGGRGVKWLPYTRKDGAVVKVQGTYERRLCVALDTQGVKWDAHPNIRLVYVDSGGRRKTYGPDFYLPEFRCYLETKGWYPEQDQHKMRSVAENNPGVRVEVLFESDLRVLESGFPIAAWLADKAGV